MRFQLDIILTEEDYLAYNRFHSFESSFAKKQITKSRFVFIGVIALFSLLIFLLEGWSEFMVFYLALMSLTTVVFMLLYKKIMYWSLTSQIKRLKKIGKLPYHPVSRIEFHDDKVVEITDSTRNERSYHAFVRTCVLKDRFIFLYDSTMSAFILPMSQIIEQVDAEDFLSFLKQKCNNIEYY